MDSISLLLLLFVEATMAAREVIVVGGGLAGLSASIEAASNGAHVTIIEKGDVLGGNSAKATSGINGADTIYQQNLGIRDDASLLERDTLDSGGGLSNVALIKTLASESSDAISFLQLFDINLDDVVQLGGHSVARTHRISPTKDGRPVPVGFSVISKLKKHIETVLSPKIEILFKRKFIGLIFKGKQVIGLKFISPEGLEKEIFGNVVLAAGGFAHDNEWNSLLAKYAPNVYFMPTTNGPWATGDIIKGTMNNNLSLVHMDKVQIHPTSFFISEKPLSKSNFLAPESLRGCGGILLNSLGSRFVNELGRRDHVTKLILEKCDNFEKNPAHPVVCTLLLNDEVVEKFGRPMFNFYKSKHLIREIGNLQDVSNLMKVDLETLRQTLLNYSKSSSQGSDSFGKTFFPVLFNPEDHFYVAYITPAVHYCMGGIQINERSQVLHATDLLPVPGLFAAGEVTGGIHGENRLGGNSLLECVVFGRIAGREASIYEQVAELWEEGTNTKLKSMIFIMTFLICLLLWLYRRCQRIKYHKINTKSF